MTSSPADSKVPGAPQTARYEINLSHLLDIRLNMRRTRAIARKELLHIVRDRRSLILALSLPVLMLVMFGSALSLDVDHIRTVVYDPDRSPASRDLVEQFRASRFFAGTRDAPGRKSRIPWRATEMKSRPSGDFERHWSGT